MSATKLTTILQQQLRCHAPEAQRLVVAVSGGSDSVALLLLLRDIQHKAALTLQVGHFHHHIRPHECARDAAFTQALCQQLGIPCEVGEADVPAIATARGLNQEAVSRQLRYSFLHRLAKRSAADIILTAHSQQDQAETVLMQLMRGAAFASGMRPRHKRVLRPLLGLSRQQLQTYLQQQGQPWMDDTTNQDTHFTRAWLRHVLLPLWQTRQATILSKLAAFASKQQSYQDYLAEHLAPFVKHDSLDLQTLQGMHPALQRYALAQQLRQADIAPDDAHLQRLQQALHNLQPTQSQRVALPNTRYARLDQQGLCILTTPAAPPTPVPSTESLPHPLPTELDGSTLRHFPNLVQRRRQAGDTIQLAGGHRTVKQLLIDRKIPRETRDHLRIIASGKQVLWIEGVAVDIRVKRKDYRSHADWMGLALAQAKRAFAQGEVPVGAIIVCGDRLLSQAHNCCEQRHDPCAHAELRAIQGASQQRGDWRLSDCRLYVSLEPCLMCVGAILQAHIPQVIYGARNLRQGALGGVQHAHHAAPYALSIHSGVRAKESEALLRAFFAQQRR